MYSSARADIVLSQQFAPISLKALEAKAGMLRRRDNKYVVERSLMQEALKLFAEHFDVLEIGGRRSFTYETCYFDSLELECYKDHHRGRRCRAKVRIRNYIDSDMCFVEVKLKDKRGETIKRRLAHERLSARYLDSRALEFVNSCFRKQYRKDFPYDLKRALDMRYKRVTLVAKEGGERMTIDNQLVFMNSNASCPVDGDVFVVETKSSNGNGIADKVLRSLHRHPTKHCSKYCAGIAALREDVTSNNFLPVLRKLVQPYRQSNTLNN
jgi:VTC domain